MAARDPVVLAFASIATGTTAGAAIVTLGMIVLRVTALAQTDTGSMPFLIITTATLAGAFASAGTTWHLTRPIDDFWKRGITSAIATMLGFVIGAATAPVDMVGGLIGLTIFAVVLATAAAVSYRKATRAAA